MVTDRLASLGRNALPQQTLLQQPLLQRTLQKQTSDRDDETRCGGYRRCWLTATLPRIRAPAKAIGQVSGSSSNHQAQATANNGTR